MSDRKWKRKKRIRLNTKKEYRTIKNEGLGKKRKVTWEKSLINGIEIK